MEGRGGRAVLIIELYLSHPQRFEHHFDFKHVFKPTELTDLNSFMNYASSIQWMQMGLLTGQNLHTLDVLQSKGLRGAKLKAWM